MRQIKGAKSNDNKCIINSADKKQTTQCRPLSPAPLPQGEGNKCAGFGHVRGRIGKNRKGFTLSETLITLVIIGIIAAITIPAISRSSEKYILKNQFKKTYSTIANAIQKTDMDIGGNTVCYYIVTGNTENGSDCTTFFKQFINNLSIQKACKGNAKADGCLPSPWLKTYPKGAYFQQNLIETVNQVYVLADGAIIVLYNTYTESGFYPLFIVDINGAKGPNTLGKDAFIFYIASDGQNGLKIGNDLLVWATNESRSGIYFRYLSDIYKE